MKAGLFKDVPLKETGGFYRIFLDIVEFWIWLIDLYLGCSISNDDLINIYKTYLDGS